MADTYPITGIQVDADNNPLDPTKPDDARPLRREVDEWLLDTDDNTKKQVSLFFNAVDRFQKLPAEDKLSYWQVAGIHGQPLIPWDEDTTSKSAGRGYCPHNSTLFPTWHRPYVLLFEQRVYEIMLEIIANYPSDIQSDWLTAARGWRLPYWDWAAKKERTDDDGTKTTDYDVPLIVTEQSVDITDDGTTTKKIPNPFYQFTSPAADNRPLGLYGKYALSPVTYGTGDDATVYHYEFCQATSRRPPEFQLNSTSSVTAWSKGVQNNEEVAEAIRGHGWHQDSRLNLTDTVGEAVYRLFAKSSFASYTAFGTTRYVQSDKPAYLNLEDIHNNVHDWTGGPFGGFMASVPVAAFDPIFWLHHCNVDRQIAIWQALYKDEWFDDAPGLLTDAKGNWSTAPNTLCTPTTLLAPFHCDSEGDYYTSDAVRYWTTLGYTYPELQRWKYDDDTKYIKSINKALKNLYSTTAVATAAATEKLTTAASALKRSELASTKDALLKFISDGERGPRYRLHDDYVINIRYERFALGGAPFSIHVIIGKEPEPEYHAGSVYNFCTPPNTAGSSNDGCQNCKQQIADGALQKGQLPITNVLLAVIRDNADRLGRERERENAIRRLSDPKYLKKLKQEDVVNYLKHNIRVEVYGLNNKKIPVESIPSLKVYVAGGRGKEYEDDTIISAYLDHKELREITADMPGGLGPNDEP